MQQELHVSQLSYGDCKSVILRFEKNYNTSEKYIKTHFESIFKAYTTIQCHVRVCMKLVKKLLLSKG